MEKLETIVLNEEELRILSGCLMFALIFVRGKGRNVEAMNALWRKIDEKKDRITKY